jgi:LPXTG-motif cell wall-anchored protein
MRRWGWRATISGAVAVAASLAVAVPAFGHATFPNQSAFGFQPNPEGGTGAPGATPPYIAGTQYTVTARVPKEGTTPFNGGDDTNARVEIVVPAEWTNATCGDAKASINDASTNNTNQPGAVVPGWTCTLDTVASHQRLTWNAPPNAQPTTADSAQYFVFTVTTPSPSAQTTYNGQNGTEGFVIDQVYLSGRFVRWVPTAGYTAVTPAPQGAEIEESVNLARTVAAVGVIPTTTTTTAPATTTTVTAATVAPTTAAPPATVAPAAELPRTGGSDMGPLALIGAALVAGGLLLVRRSRKQVPQS